MNAELLLADRSPCLRLLVLRNCLGLRASHPEVKELAALRQSDPFAAAVIGSQEPEGSWPDPNGPRSSARAESGRLIATSVALSRLSLLGFTPSHPAIQRGAAFLFSRQKPDGSWPLPSHADGGRYSMMPLQTALPLAGLARAGFAEDPRAERAYDWLLSKRLEDGAWPTGIASGVRGFVGGYRRLPHSRWGCRSNTTAALICLAHHPKRKRSDEARMALDHLLARETRDRASLGFEPARVMGFEPVRGFVTFHAVFDPALVLDLCARLGASVEDARVAELAGFVRSCASPSGLWEYRSNPLATRWVTYVIHSALTTLETPPRGGKGWVWIQPRTPFQAYPRARRRY